MKYQIIQFTEEHISPAVDLFLHNDKREQDKNPLQPSEIINEPERIIMPLKSIIGNPGVGIIIQDKLAAYMITGPAFQFKCQNAVLVPEFCHSAEENNKKIHIN